MKAINLNEIRYKKFLHTWTLFNTSQGLVTITNPTLEKLKNQDVVAINYLCNSYTRYKGIILNEDVDFDKYLQVSAFLGSICTIRQDYTVIILCKDDAIIKWHYYISNYGQLEPYIITTNFQVENLCKYARAAFLLGFSNINMLKYFEKQDFVVIDDIDMVANKTIIKEICGNFHIGLTSRNFYVYPDQKLQWLMLKWSNPGCVGKFADFQELDNDNFANLRDNYKEWWIRLTWTYCDTFIKPTENEKAQLEVVLNNWKQEQGLGILEINNINLKKRKSKLDSRLKCHVSKQSYKNSNYNHKVVSETSYELIQSTSESCISKENETFCPLMVQEKDVKVSLSINKNEQVNIININTNKTNYLDKQILDNDKSYTFTSEENADSNSVDELLNDVYKLIEKVN
ncbi:hypothetical protein GWI33_021344 [Rhynchophorus ferrugineus]|uniref:Uncharacterized protein n=1 Tax=Rhynchophorus ferrugineus TaxID=354439 RepID=A0A834HSS0_RHYFE|nr:hypothetical protein GWI33_021344 [Rhynchophorus ferrugineus]